MEQKEEKKTTATKATQAVKKVRSMVRTMYTSAQEAKRSGTPVAYCMIASHYDEILRAMDIVPIWTENYAGLCAAKRSNERFIMKAEAEGYSSAVCGYVRTGIGFDALRAECGDIPTDSPDGGMVMPDILLGSSQTCDPRFKWYQALGKYMNIPIHNIDVVTPSVTADLDEVKDYYVKYQYEQFTGLISFLEEYTKKKLDPERLWAVIDLSDKTWRRWWEVDQLRKAVPSPMPSEDHYNAMVPGRFYCGTPEALAFYDELYQEVKERVENGIGVVPDEKYRLLFGGGLPPWHTMWIFNYFESLGAVFVIENAYRSFDPVEVPVKVNDPVMYLAWRVLLRNTQRFDKARKRSGHPVVERLLDLIKEYKIDGVMFHASRSCRATTVGQLHMKNLFQKYVDIPAIQLISDMVDLRDYSEAMWKAQIDAFVESVSVSKNKSPAIS